MDWENANDQQKFRYTILYTAQSYIFFHENKSKENLSQKQKGLTNNASPFL